MRINKKIPFYVFILFLFMASFGAIYAVMAKSNLKPKTAADVRNIDESSKAVENAVENAPLSVPVSDQGGSVPANTQAPTTAVDPAVSAKNTDSKYPLHKNISTTYFWAGEEAGKDNKNISNLPSAWDEDWVKHFGGIDTPEKRNGFYPAGFTPKENPFYFALPYNDFNSKGKQKNDTIALAMWSGSIKSGAEQSLCKNQWIKITKGGKTAYAQWEDVGPYGEDDNAYVFGNASPKSKENDHAGLDVSPAVHDYLGLGDMDKTDWQFVDADDVPAGPWKNIITTSQVFWK